MGLEQWKPIEGYDGKYYVSDQGRIKNKNGLILKMNVTNDNYYSVKLYKNGGYKHRLCHRIVAETFVPINNQDNLYEVDHIDNNRQNNCVSNLRWGGTRSKKKCRRICMVL